jgi:hypothetical protein
LFNRGAGREEASLGKGAAVAPTFTLEKRRIHVGTNIRSARPTNRAAIENLQIDVDQFLALEINNLDKEITGSLASM